MRARLARVLIAVALLAGWQAALVHPLGHLNADGGFVHLADGDPGSYPSDKSELCDALAALTACAWDAPLAFDFSELRQQFSSSFKTALRAAEAPPFLAQGPPALL